MQSYTLCVAIGNSLVAYLRCLVGLFRITSVAHWMAYFIDQQMACFINVYNYNFEILSKVGSRQL